MGGGGGGGGVVGQFQNVASGGGSAFTGGMSGIMPGGNAYNQGMKYLDPLDITGTQQGQRDKDTSKLIEQQQAQMDDFMSRQPNYQGMQNDAGTGLKKAFQVAAPEDATTATTSIASLDSRMGKAKDVGVADVKYTGDINSGKNFDAAQKNVNALQERAFGTGPSAWAQSQLDSQAYQQKQQLGRLGQEQRTAFNQSQNDLAMQGGLEGGSRERLAKAAQKQTMLSRQGAFNQGAGDRMAIRSADEAQRMQLQQQMPGMNMQMDQYKTGLAQQNRDVQNQLNLSNQQTNLGEQQFNANLAMNKANQWAGVQGQNNAALNATSQFNAGQQNQVNQINQATMVGNNQAQNAYALDRWKTQGSVIGNTQTANQQASQASGSGGLLSKIGLG